MGARQHTLYSTHKFGKLPIPVILEAERHYQFPIHDLTSCWKPPTLLPLIATTCLPLELKDIKEWARRSSNDMRLHPSSSSTIVIIIGPFVCGWGFYIAQATRP
ncbi:hypothetical protein BDV36DRAFT_262961 [Aspergillus pseudocaelatus]|uniref:Uncharacterized protein n=1 Tax=Aspergillus pseudocaelatus TaxID=1825620 RepID=A0ABQ6WE63_9EURO|nr:hypothetical protein BDV36DRAFT_262961 [Aspergillus pseudocaelatus]